MYYLDKVLCFSLPLPWLLSALIFGPVKVSSAGMACSIVILFLMLLFVIISIALFKWKMNLGLALVMFLLYFAFVAMSLLLEYGIIDCEVIMEFVGFHWWSFSRCLPTMFLNRINENLVNDSVDIFINETINIHEHAALFQLVQANFFQHPKHMLKRCDKTKYSWKVFLWMS